MTNAALQAFVAEYGERIFAITLDNNHKIFMGVAARLPYDTTTAASIQYKTFGDTDMFGIPHTDVTYEGIAVPYINWMVTGCIQAIHVTDESDGQPGTYLPDLNKFF